MVPRSRPTSIVPDQEKGAERSRVRRRPVSSGGCGSSSIWANLIALILIMFVPLALVLAGNAGVAVIVATSEFVVVVFHAWRRANMAAQVPPGPHDIDDNEMDSAARRQADA